MKALGSEEFSILSLKGNVRVDNAMHLQETLLGEEQVPSVLGGSPASAPPYQTPPPRHNRNLELQVCFWGVVLGVQLCCGWKGMPNFFQSLLSLINR